ncbi:Hypothetical protein A7982_09882 [Minicystis rosea]|nr:Hypothetical protein A7982_09882 [Minicystis rosea]
MLVLSATTLLACGGSVTLTTGGTTSGSSTGTSGGVGGAGGEGGFGGQGGTGGGGETCERTYDRFSFSLVDANGTAIGCSAAMPGVMNELTIQGVVLERSDKTLTIDTCPPDVDCDSDATYHLEVDSPGFYMSAPIGSFIEIAAKTAFGWGCTSTLVGRNLPDWDGVPNPVSTEPWLHFVGVDGLSQAPEGLPFSVWTTALGCTPTSEGCGGGNNPDDYRFDVKTLTTDAVSIRQGETKDFVVSDGSLTQPLMFRNLRSFETGYCDDYWNWGFWVLPLPPPK